MECTAPLFDKSVPGFFDSSAATSSWPVLPNASAATSPQVRDEREYGGARFQMASVLQLMVPLCIVLSATSLSPFLGVLVAIPVLPGAIATVYFVYSEAKQRRSVLLQKRIRIFLHFTLLSGVMGMTFPMFGFCAGSVVGGLVGASIGALGGVVLVLVMLRNATGAFPSK